MGVLYMLNKSNKFFVVSTVLTGICSSLAMSSGVAAAEEDSVEFNEKDGVVKYYFRSREDVEAIFEDIVGKEEAEKMKTSKDYENAIEFYRTLNKEDFESTISSVKSQPNVEKIFNIFILACFSIGLLTSIATLCIASCFENIEERFPEFEQFRDEDILSKISSKKIKD